MATPVEVESEDNLRRLVQEHETVIVSCFSSSEGGESEDDLHQELVSAVTSTVLGRTDLNTVRAAGLLLPSDQEGGEEDGAKHYRGVWWLFFRGGEMVRILPMVASKANIDIPPQWFGFPLHFKFNEDVDAYQGGVGKHVAE